MLNEQKYEVRCGCEQILITMFGEPKVRGFCHCEDCRDLLNIPYHSVDAWEKNKVKLTKGECSLRIYQHPNLNMKKYFCANCGDVVFNSNAMDWRVFSQLLLKKSYGGVLPEQLRPKSHFFYGSRIIDVDDDLPKRD